MNLPSINDLYQEKAELTQRVEELEKQHAAIAAELSQVKKRLGMVSSQLLWRYQERFADDQGKTKR